MCYETANGASPPIRNCRARVYYEILLAIFIQCRVLVMKLLDISGILANHLLATRGYKGMRNAMRSASANLEKLITFGKKQKTRVSREKKESNRNDAVAYITTLLFSSDMFQLDSVENKIAVCEFRGYLRGMMDVINMV